jgi:hypothetical protein
MLNTSNVAAASYHTDAMLAALSGTFIRGRGVRVSSGGGYKMGMDFEEPYGFRAIAFWSTGDVTLLDELGADYLLVDPAKLDPRAYERLAREGRLKLLFREAGLKPGTIREVYRVEKGLGEPVPPVPADLRLDVGPAPPRVQPGRFYDLPLSVETRDPSFEGRMKVGYRVFHGGRLMNWNDEVRHIVNFEHGGRERWTGFLHFVAPYDAGRYDVTVQAFDERGGQDKAKFMVDIVTARDESRR